MTQHPVTNTVLDFWQMVWDYRVTTVTCLSPEVSGGHLLPVSRPHVSVIEQNV